MTGRVPDFLGIGAQKAGTSWLCEMLRVHPQVAFPGGKEVHFWDWHYDRGLDWYRGLFADAPADRKVGDITPGYAVLTPPAIRTVRQAMPDARLIFMVRNPIERAWSAAVMILRWALMAPEEVSDAWFIDVFRSQQSLGRGDYAACLAAWLREYPPEQFLIAFYDDIARAPRPLLAGVCRHIGIGIAPDARWTDERLSARVNAGEGTPLRPSLLAPLRDLYAERIETFSRLIGRDLSHWLR